MKEEILYPFPILYDESGCGWVIPYAEIEKEGSNVLEAILCFGHQNYKNFSEEK